MAPDLLEGLPARRTGLGRGTPARRRQRFLASSAVAAAVAVGGIALVACTPVLSLTVDTAVDGVDVSPGDGVCAMSGGGCTLRAAVMESNATPGRDLITIQSGIDPVLDLVGSRDDANGGGDLDVAGVLEVVGNGATIDGAGLDRVFDLLNGRLSLAGVTITGGQAPAGEGGAGIRSHGYLSLSHAKVTGNRGSAVESAGTSLFVADSEIDSSEVEDSAGDAIDLVSGSATIVRSLVVNTDASWTTTALDVQGAQSDITVLDSTLSAGHGVLRFAPTATSASGTILRSTLSTSSGAQYLAQPVIDKPVSTAVTVSASVLDAPNGGPWSDVCSSPLTSGGHNVLSGSGCGTLAVGDVVQPALLGPLVDNGGPTRTMLPYPGSPAIDRVPVGGSLCPFVPIDQRDLPRPAGSACDAGAAEGVGPAVEPVEVTVDSPLDAVDVAPGDGTCASAAGSCTLRAAVMEVNAAGAGTPSPFFNRIDIASGVDPMLTIGGAGEDGALTGDLDVSARLLVDGHGATVDGNELDRIFHSTSQRLYLEGLTLTGGRVAGHGAGVRGEAGTVDLVDSTFEGNSTVGTDGVEYWLGGAISASWAHVSKSTFRGNSASSDGGGLHTSGGLVLAESTVEGNSAGNSGGGIMVDGSGVVMSSTIVGNSAKYGGGISAAPIGSSLRIETSTLSGNAASVGYSEIEAPGFGAPGLELVSSTVVGTDSNSLTITTQGRYCSRFGCTSWPSVVATGSIIVATPGQQVCDAPLTSDSTYVLSPDPAANCGTSLPGSGALGPLTDNGGPTTTMLPLPGSGAQDAIPVGTPGLCDSTPRNDQRGVARPTGAACDVGAVEQ